MNADHAEDKMGELERLIPANIKGLATASGSELVIPYPEVLEVIQIGSQNAIAILGVELFQVLDAKKAEVLVLDYSHYEFHFHGDWQMFVFLNNQEAVRFVQNHVRGEEHGYILTSTSREEFDQLKAEV